jgi:Cu(I)/Ag(I) efflux system membrane fusion protein
MLFVAACVLTTANVFASSDGKPVKQKKNKTEVPEIACSGLTVQGNCEKCKERIEAAANSVKGVVGVADWNAESKYMHIHFDTSKTSLKTISKAIVKAGYDTELHKAKDKAYNALPKCCQYRDN